jgi:hypothetical protein
MSKQMSCPDDRVLPVRVWPQLGAEHRSQVIRLMAHLAFKLVLAQANSPFQEVHHGVTPERIQNSG